MNRRPIIHALYAALLSLLLPALSGAMTFEELKSMEGKVKSVVKKAMPATVALVAEKSPASGTGIIISKDGLILTAAHVVEGSEYMDVLFPDGRSARAQVLGANRTLDAAMAKIVVPDGESPAEWPFVNPGVSSPLKTTDIVIAMGHPGGFELRRPPPVRIGRIVNKEDDGFLMSDCTLVGGDSGGPLFDLDGHVIGIHSSIGGKVEQNLHVPADAFHKHWDALKAGRLWGSLNNTMRYDPRLADDPLARAVLGAKLDRDSVGGVRVVACPPEMPAAMAGLKPGDIILSAGGTATSGYSDLAGVLAEAAPEQAVALQVRRQGKETTIQVKLADREALASR
ncbi:MAG: S1C family serine protease [Verrucomicrobiales bacterium]